MTISCTSVESTVSDKTPVEVRPFYKVPKVTGEQIDYVRALAEKVVAPEELNQVNITIQNNCHPGTDYYAIIHLPRLASWEQAVYRTVNVYNTNWPSRRADRRKDPTPTEWSHERAFSVVPLFKIDEKEYEIHHSDEITRMTIYQILRLIINNDVICESEDVSDENWPIKVDAIRNIYLRDEHFRIQTSEGDIYNPHGQMYEAHIDGEKLKITRLGRWVS